LDRGHLTGQTGIGFKPPTKARDGFAHKLIVQTTSQLAQFSQEQPARSPPEPQRPIAAPVAMAMGEKNPTFALGRSYANRF
jgi:hypothetical protein